MACQASANKASFKKTAGLKQSLYPPEVAGLVFQIRVDRQQVIAGAAACLDKDLLKVSILGNGDRQSLLVVQVFSLVFP